MTERVVATTLIARGVPAYQARMAAASRANMQFGASAAAPNASMATMGRRVGGVGTQLGLLNPKLLGPAGLVYALGRMTGAANEWNETAVRIRTQIGLTAGQTSQLADAARETGIQFGIGGQAAFDASWFIASAGLRGKDATDALAASAKGAALGLGETAMIADLVTSAINAYGSDVLGASDAMDVLIAAVREGKAEAPELAGSLGQVLPIASELGMSFNELGGAVAAMTRTGTNAGTAVIQLRQILMGLLNPTQQANAQLAEYGLTAEQLRAQLRQDGLISVLHTLRDAFGDNEEAMSVVFGNARSLMGVLDLVGANADENAAIIERMANVTGDADEAFKELEATSTSFQWQKLKANIADVGREIGGPFNTALRETLKVANTAFDAAAGRMAEDDPYRLTAALADTRFEVDSLKEAIKWEDDPNVVTELQARLDELVPRLRELEMQDLGRGMAEISGELDAIAEGAARANAPIYDLQRNIKLTGDVSMDARHGLGWLEGDLHQLAAAFDTTTEAIEEINKFIHGMTDPFFQARQSAERVRIAQEKLAEVQADSKASAEDLAAAQWGAIEAERAHEVTLAELWAKVDDGQTSLGQARKQFFEYGRSANIAEEDIESLWEEAAGFYDDASTRDPVKIVVDSREAMSRFEKAIQRGETFGGMRPEAKLSVEDAEARARIIGLSRLADEATRARTLRIDANVTAAARAAQQMNAPIYDRPRGRAAGGPMWPGAWKVGEQGPEIIQLGERAHAFNARETARMIAAGFGAPMPAVRGSGSAAAGSHRDRGVTLAEASRPIEVQVQAWTDRFSVAQVMDELAMHGAV